MHCLHNEYTQWLMHVLCCVTLRYAVLCCAVLCCAVLCCAVLCYLVMYCKKHCCCLLMSIRMPYWGNSTPDCCGKSSRGDRKSFISNALLYRAAADGQYGVLGNDFCAHTSLAD